MQGTDSFIDAVGGVYFNGHVVKVDCLSVYPQPSDPKKVSSKLAGRLVLSPASAMQLRDLLDKLFEDLKKQTDARKKE
jgi:hypothetical protein